MKIRNHFNILVSGLLILFIVSCSGVDSGLKAKSKFRGIVPGAVDDDNAKTDSDPVDGSTDQPSDQPTNLSTDQSTDQSTDELSIVEVPLSFETIKTLILEDNCINCHTGKHSVFELYSLAQIYSDDILQRITTKNLLKRMPPSRPPLPDELIDLFKAWVEIGTPEFEDNLVFPIDKKFIKEKSI